MAPPPRNGGHASLPRSIPFLPHHTHTIRFNRFEEHPDLPPPDYHITAAGTAWHGQGRQITTVRHQDWTTALRFTMPRVPLIVCPPAGEGKHASSGLAAILHFLATADHIHLIGFDHGATGTNNSDAHDWGLEASICSHLVTQGRLTYL